MSLKQKIFHELTKFLHYFVQLQREHLHLGSDLTHRNQANYQLNYNVLSTLGYLTTSVERTMRYDTISECKHTKGVVGWAERNRNRNRNGMELMWYSVVFGVVVEYAARNAAGFLLFLSQVCKLQHFPVNHIGRLRFCFLFLTVIFSLCACVCVCVFISISFTAPSCCPSPTLRSCSVSLSLSTVAGHFPHFRDAFVTFVLFHFHLRFRVRNCGFVFVFVLSFFCFPFSFLCQRVGESGRCDRNSVGKERATTLSIEMKMFIN